MSADLLDSLDIFVPEDISEWVQICLLVWIGIFVPEDIIIPRYSSEPEHVGDTEQRAENSGNHRHMVQKIIHQAKLCSGN